MAHKTLIGGTAYDTTGGKCLVGGTGYSIQKGRTLVGGTGYDISFETIVNIPSQSGTLTYTGSTQSPSWSNYDSSLMTVSGTTSSIKAGTYTAIFTLKDNCVWSDGTTSNKSVMWKINKASPNFTMDPMSCVLDYSDACVVKFTYSGSGTISAIVSEDNEYGLWVSKNSSAFNDGVEKRTEAWTVYNGGLLEGSYVVTFNLSETTNYLFDSETFKVTAIRT